ncbi:mycothiol-dependent maleylpyruvate isomerase [Enemella evansiae]|uniref:Mycothiol-dependent maleylpyruvate isomerase n=1 Tax=Enemella evansiae TaxID=2016499 RepID=A0A255G530_9ACTN|nr:maleylpyruvate isomerase family mycothiol-dependent enzyme [Enemella evansiae]OYO10572.1 mycothiol-dependent maleylpyruvate isomerase [Enemella evansiae]
MEPIGAFKRQALLPGDLNRLDRETGMLLATVDSLAEDELRGPSLCEGWSRAQVIGHLIGNADAMANLAHWARTGEETPMYASKEARNAAIDERAALPRQQLKEELHAASDRLRAALDELSGGVDTEVLQATFGPLNAWAVPALRITEVILHHHDLDTLWTLEEADMDAQEDGLLLCVGMSSGKDWGSGVRLITDEGEDLVLGAGETTLRGGRDALLAWLARGQTDGVRGEPPARPDPTLG